jgi:hypothetical protein
MADPSHVDESAQKERWSARATPAAARKAKSVRIVAFKRGGAIGGRVDASVDPRML